MAILDQLSCPQGVEYRHGERNGCLKGTREALLDEIELWTKDFDKPSIYWLNGLAGTGKSAIAQTIAERAFTDGQLGASFFCSRDSKDRSNPRLIFPTLAVQLARRHPKFRSSFVPRVRGDPQIFDTSLSHQMMDLIVSPLMASAISTVIVIDALDECDGEESTSAILSVLGQFISEIPKVKFIVTGRPVPWIIEGFRLLLFEKTTDVFVLHELEPSQVDHDIRLFFRHKISELARRRRGLDNWPTEEHLDLLCERAAGLFLYAVATVKFIDHQHSDPRGQLNLILQSPKSSLFEGKTWFEPDKTLDSLYMSTLQQAFGRHHRIGDQKGRSVLGAVTLATTPLSPSAIAPLLGCDTYEVFSLLSSAGSLLVLQEDFNSPVRPFHQSFPDFTTDPERCTNQKFHVSPPEHHQELLIGSLRLMNRELERNMCKLSDGVTNSEVDDLGGRAERYIDHGLRYACESWYKHLVDEDLVRTPKVVSKLRMFLEKKFLFWLEVLSVLGSVRSAVRSLNATKKWLKEVRLVSSRGTLPVFT